MTRKYESFNFEWVLRQGPSEAAIESLRSYLPGRPSKAPGEAWFMSKERKFWTQFVELPIEQISDSDIDHFLFDTTSGMNAFPECVEEIRHWNMWFKYFLPHCICRPGGRLIGTLITTFIRVFGDQPEAENVNLRADALNTLGAAVTGSEYWTVERMSRGCGDKEQSFPHCYTHRGNFTAAMFFCLLYLPSSNVEHWTESLLRIRFAPFRAELMVWLASAHHLLTSERCTLAFLAEGKGKSTFGWQHDFLLSKMPIVISNESRKIFIETFRKRVSMQILLGWLDDIAAFPEIEEELQILRTAEILADEILVRAK